MSKRTGGAVGAAAAGGRPIAELIDAAADLKGELVEFAQRPRFAAQLTTLLIAAADPHRHLNEASAVITLDRFALQHRLPDGRTVVERFVAERHPRLSADERTMVLGWRDVVEGCFEVDGLDGDAVRLHNLLDDVVYRVYSNMGPRVLVKLRTGMFLVGRIMPVHPATDAWLISGHCAMFARSARREIARSALDEVTAHPELMRRNPALLQRAWERQAEHRSEFIEQVGSDLVVLPPREAQETVREHYRRLRRKAVARVEGAAAKRAAAAGPPPEELDGFPDDLLAADDVALIYDDVEGLNFFRNFGRLEALFANPAPDRDRADLAQLDEYLHDDSVSPLAIRRLAERHPEGADQVFRLLLRKPGFSWARDGEKLLRRHKKSFLDREPMPGISLVGRRLAELLGTAG